MVPDAAEPPATPSTDQVALPLLAVNCCGTVGVSVAVRGVTINPLPPPVPDTAIKCGLPGALSAIVSVAFSGPDALGENSTLIVQLAPEASDVPQLFVWVKSSPPELESAMPAIAMAAAPLFVNVTVCGILLVPIAWLLKFRWVALRLSPGRRLAGPSGLFMSFWISGSESARL